MRPHYSLLPSAELDLGEQLKYIAERNFEAALRFHAMVRRTCEQLAALPYSGESYPAIRPRVLGLRVTTLPKFSSYRLFYRIVGRQAIEVIRILHTARDLPRELGGSR